VADKLIKKSWLQKIGFFADERFLCENNLFGGGRISREETPIDEATIAKVRIVRILGCQRQNLKCKKCQLKQKLISSFISNKVFRILNE